MKNRLIVLFYAILAGAAIAFGGLLFLLSKAFIPADSPVPSQLVGALLFPVGLLLVCYFKLNLYTGKIGMPSKGAARASPAEKTAKEKAEFTSIWVKAKTIKPIAKAPIAFPKRIQKSHSKTLSPFLSSFLLRKAMPIFPV